VQLNVYALLAEATNLGKTSKLALLYTSPQTAWSDAAKGLNIVAGHAFSKLTGYATILFSLELFRSLFFLAIFGCS
jgi:hypothetical protein